MTKPRSIVFVALLASCIGVDAIAAAQPTVTMAVTPPPPPVHCYVPHGAPRTGPTPTGFEERLERAASRVSIIFQPDTVPNAFVLHFAQGWFGQTPPPVALEPGSIATTLNDAAGNVVERPTLVGPVPIPRSLYNPCFNDGGVTYRFTLQRPPEQGMYTLHVSARAQPLHVNGDTVIPAGSASLNVYFPPPPVQPPSLRLGQPYLVVPAPGVTYVDTSGKTVGWNLIAMHVARIDRIDDTSLSLHVDETNVELSEPRNEDSPALPGLLILVDDASRSAMASWYGGERIWVRGGLGTTCSLQPNSWSGFGGPNAPLVRVKHVYRIEEPFTEMGIGTEMETIGGTRESAFETGDPLLVTLSVEGRPTAFGGSSSGVPPPAGSSGWGCGDAYTFFADAWDMQRAFSTRSVRDEHPDWPAAMLASIEAGKLTDGMTRDMVLWTIGFPSTYAPIEQLHTMRDWRYDDLPPFNFWVHFDANGRVISFGADGHLP